jgi:hypothetical protein
VFTHPLARTARVWHAVRDDGSERPVLIIVTTMELDPSSNRYKSHLVERLSRSAKDYVSRSFEVDSYVVMNPDNRLII